jgi:hypothetical protein
MARKDKTPVPDVDYVPGLSAENNPRRGGNFRTATEERQQAALEGLKNFGANIPQRVSSEIESEKRVLSGNAKPDKKKQAEGIINRLTQFQEALGTYSTGMSQSVRAVTEAARMPIEAARLQSRQEGRLIVPEAGLFYPKKFEMTRQAAQSHSRDTGHIISTLLATPRLSVLSDPQTELQAGSALSFLKAHGHHGSVTLSDNDVKRINSDLIAKGKSHAQDLIPHSGTHPLSTLPPSVLAGLATHHRAINEGNKSTVSHWFSESKINAPDSLSDALHDFGNFGAGGWTKGADAVRTFNNPYELFGKKSIGGGHKVPSYTLNTLKSSSDLYNAGVHHFLGHLTHGEEWARQNPDSVNIIEKASRLPHWTDPTYTGDVHSSKLSTGLPPEVTRGLGDILRPANIFTGATALPRGGGRGHPFLQTAPDMGYYIGEEAHNRASRTSHFVTGVSGLKIPSPVEVTQALGWAGKQAQDKGETLRNIQRATDMSQIINPNQINQFSPLRTYKA